jgi:membrane associated rhomboid family serine protease
MDVIVPNEVAKRVIFPNLTLIRRKESYRCPDCAVWMTPFSCENVIVHKCSQCQGIWFDHGEIGVFRDSLMRFDLSTIHVAIEGNPLAEIVLSTCPRCQRCLEEFTYSSNTKIRLRRCGKCLGIWSPLGGTLGLIELSKLSQAIAPDVRGLLTELSASERENQKWKELTEIDRQLKRPANWMVAPNIILPLHDNVERSGFPWVSVAFVALCTLVLMLGGPTAVETWGLKPSRIASASELYTLVTSIFVHAGILHLVGNSIYLWIFGRSVEDRIGRWNYAALLLFAGVVGGLAFVLADPGGTVPCVGASGAISGVLGSYFFLFPTATISVLIGNRVVALPSWMFLACWFVFQFFMTAVDSTATATQVAWIAHVSGFAVAVVFTALLVRVKLVQRPTLSGVR